MKLIQSFIEKGFTLEHKGKTYYVNYLNSDGQILGLLNRDNWEILDEEFEEVSLYTFSNTTGEEKKQIDKNAKMVDKVIKFCKKHFNDYRPDYKND